MKARTSQREGIDDEILSDPAYYESLSLNRGMLIPLASLEKYEMLSSWFYACCRNKTTQDVT
jgi:hypothetical protein